MTTLEEFLTARVLQLSYALAEEIDAALIEMTFGNGGALKGVLVEQAGFERTVSLVDPADDHRALAGTIVYSFEAMPAEYSRPPVYEFVR